MSLAGRPMVEWSIAAFGACEAVAEIVVAAPASHVGGLAADLVEEAGTDLRPIVGGATRAESVAIALELVETELVAIHDAARPLLTPELVEAIVADLDAAPEAAGAIAATPVTDTVKRATEGTRPAFPGAYEANAGLVVGETLDRGELWAAQTPQVFRVEALREALAGAEDAEAATDEAMLVEAAGGTVLIHPCGPGNLKVTTPHDLRLAELLLAKR